MTPKIKEIRDKMAKEIPEKNFITGFNAGYLEAKKNIENIIFGALMDHALVQEFVIGKKNCDWNIDCTR